MGLQPENNSLSSRDKVVGHQRVLALDELSLLFENSGFKVIDKFGYFIKTVPNGMMVNYSPDLLKALTSISYGLPPGLMANIGLIATRV